MSASPLVPRETRALAELEPEQQMRLLRSMSEADLLRFDFDFESWAHPGQREPEGGWRTWLIMAGRGYGKTRTGSEWVTRLATQRGRPVRIALVAATWDEARRVMVEGPAGLMAVGKGHSTPIFEPSLSRLTWRGGSQATLYSADNPDGLRGPEHHFAWCDELAKWSRGNETWDNLQMTLRAGERPRTLVTTTPRAVALLKRIDALPTTVTTGGRTSDNAHLPDDFVEAMARTYGGTRLGRQELDGELIKDVEGALWSRSLIEACRAPLDFARDERLEFARIVIGVDPPASAGGTCGIVALGLGGTASAMCLAIIRWAGSVRRAGRAGWRRLSSCMRRTGSWSRTIWAATWWRACFEAWRRRFR